MVEQLYCTQYIVFSNILINYAYECAYMSLLACVGIQVCLFTVCSVLMSN